MASKTTKERSRTFKSVEECFAAAGRLEEESNPVTRTACTPDLEFFKVLGIPRRGDWLSEHKEVGQTYSTYQRRMKPPMTPSKHTDTILLVPFGNFEEGVAKHFLPLLLEYCQAFFPGMLVECVEKPLSIAKAKKRQNDFGHDQYLIADLFEALNTQTRSYRRAYCRLGITLEDIYPGEEWNYVFGQAKPMERVGVFSFARHSPFFYQGLHASQVPTLKDAAGWLRACMRTMVHETCHMFGILHCVYFHCLMNGNNETLEQEQEYQVNKLMRKIDKLESDVTSKQTTLEQLRKEKVDLENTLEQEQELLVNRLWKRMDRLEAEKRMLQEKLEEPISEPPSPRQFADGEDAVEDLASHITSLREEIRRLKQQLAKSEADYCEKMAAYAKEERHIKEENIRLQRKLLREMERREALSRQLSESESSLEMDDERHFNEMTSHGTQSMRDRTSSSPLPLTTNRPISPGYGFTPPSPRMPRYPSNERLSGSHSSANSSPPTHTVQRAHRTQSSPGTTVHGPRPSSGS